MELFESRGRKFRRFFRHFVPVLFLACLCTVFIISISRTSSNTTAQEQVTLENAIRKGAIHTYALTGRYPESLSQLLEDYEITYDHSRFLVDYVPNGSNLMPVISVLPLTQEKGGLQ
jgi:hypothetical protein